MTVFISLLYWDLTRQRNYRFDILCCIKGKKAKLANSDGPINRCFQNCWAKCILSKPAVWSLAALTLVLIG